MPSFGFSDLFSPPAPKPPPKVPERWTYFSGYVLHTTPEDGDELSLLRDRLVDAMPDKATAYVIGAKPVARPKLEHPVKSLKDLKEDNASYAISIPASWAAPAKKDKKSKPEPPPTLESALEELQNLRIKRSKG